MSESESKWESPFLKIFKSHLDMVLDNHLYVFLSEQGSWTRWPPEVPSYLNHPVPLILWFLQLAIITVKIKKTKTLCWNTRQKFKFCYLLSSIISSEVLKRVNVAHIGSPSLHPSIWKVLWQHLSQNIVAGCRDVKQETFLYCLSCLHPWVRIYPQLQFHACSSFCFAFVQVEIESLVLSWNVSLPIAPVSIRGVCWLSISAFSYDLFWCHNCLMKC